MTISLVGLVAGLSFSTLTVAADATFPIGPAPAQGSGIPAIVVTLASDVVAKSSVADLKGEMKKKKKNKPTKPTLVHSPEIDARSGGQAIALIIGIMLLAFERLRKTA